MDKTTYFQEVKIEDGKLQMIVSNEPIIEPQVVGSELDFYNRISLDENGKIIIKIKS